MTLRSALPLGFLLAASASALPPVTGFTLKNGMKVRFLVDRTVPQVAVNLWVRVGSKDEAPGRSGFAHLFEHLMFMGTDRVPNGQYDRIMEAEGATNNATTAEDRTNYYSSGPSSVLPTLLWLEADRLDALGRNIDLAKLNLQRDVVKNERRQNVEDTPHGRADELLNGLLFPKGHPYDHSVIGSMRDLSAASVADVRGFFATYYVPSNVTLLIAGDFEPAKVRPLVERLFGRLSNVPAPAPRKAISVPVRGVRRVEIADRISAPRVTFAWVTAPAFSDDDVALTVASQVLTEGVTSRLYDRLVAREKLATDVTSFQYSLKYGSQFRLQADLAPGKSRERLERAMADELARFPTLPLSAAETERAKALVAASVLRAASSLLGAADVVQQIEFSTGDPNGLAREIARIRAVTPERVRAAARRWLRTDRRLNLWEVPGEPKTLPDPGVVSPKDEPPIERPATDAVGPRPADFPARAFTVPRPEIGRLRDGTLVRVFRRRGAPLAAVRAIYPGAGLAAEPAAKAGLANLAADTVGKAGGRRTSEAFSLELERLGATIGTGVSVEATAFSVDVPLAGFGPASGLLFDALLRPRMDAEDFAQGRDQTLQNLRDRPLEPRLVANDTGLAALYGADSPYARPLSGRLSTVSQLDAASARRWVRERVAPVRPILLVAADLPVAEVVRRLDAALAGRRFGTATPVARIPAPKAAKEPRLVIVDRPGSSQTTIVSFADAPRRGPGRVARQGAVTVLGGSFTSRLNQNLREAKGFTYGAGASVSDDLRAGRFTVSTSVRADATIPALREILSETDRLRAGGITAEEAKRAGRLASSSLAESAQTPSGLLDLVSEPIVEGRPLSSLDTEAREALGLTPAALDRAARTLVPFRASIVVLVGDAKRLRKELATSGLGLR